MYDSRVIKLLKTFTLKEINELYNFIDSSLFGLSRLSISHHSISRDVILNLLSELKKFFPDFSSKSLAKEKIFSKLFPGELFNDSKLRNLRHELTSAIENYLSYMDNLEEPAHFKIHLINQLVKRSAAGGLDKLLINNINEADKLMDSGKVKDEYYYFQKYILADKKWNEQDKKTYVGKTEKNFDMFKDEMNYAINSFLTIMLRELSLVQHYKTHVNLNINTGFYDHILKYILKYKPDFNLNPVHEIFIMSLNLNKGKCDKKDIIKLKNLLDGNKKLFREEDFNHLYINLFNLCLKKYTIEKEEYNDLVIGIFQKCIDYEVYIIDGIILEHNYTSIVNLLLSWNETLLAKKFIENNKNYLLPEVRDNIYFLNCASYNFSIKNYNRALEILAKVKTMDFYITTSTYHMQMRMNYEKNEISQAMNLIDSYKHFFKKNKRIPEEYRIKYGNFLLYFEELVKLKLGTSRVSSGKLIEKIKKAKKIEFSNWLITKAEELKLEL